MYGPYQAIIDSDAANLREQQALMQMLQQQAGIENTRAEMQRAQEMFPFLKEAQDLQNQGQRTVNAQRTFNLDMDTQFAPTRRSLDNATLQGNLDSRLPEHIRILSAIAPQIPSPARVAWIQDYIQKNGLSGVINLAETDPEAIPTKLSAINDELMGTNLKAYIEELKQKGATERTNMTVQGRLAAKLAGGSKSDKGKGPFIPDDKKLAGAIAEMWAQLQDPNVSNDRKEILRGQIQIYMQRLDQLATTPGNRPGSPDVEAVTRGGVPTHKPPGMVLPRDVKFPLTGADIPSPTKPPVSNEHQEFITRFTQRYNRAPSQEEINKWVNRNK